MSGPRVATALKVLAVLVIGAFVQTTFGNDLRVHGFAPDLMMLLAVSAGFSGGPDRGAAVGFASGLIADLFLQNTPFGLSALAACLTGFIVGWARSNLLRSRWALVPLVAAAGTAVGAGLFVVMGYIVGQEQLIDPGRRWLAVLVVVEAGYAVVFSLPVMVMMDWALRGPRVATGTVGPMTPLGQADLPGRRHPAVPRSRRRRRSRARVR